MNELLHEIRPVPVKARLTSSSNHSGSHLPAAHICHCRTHSHIHSRSCCSRSHCPYCNSSSSPAFGSGIEDCLLQRKCLHSANTGLGRRFETCILHSSHRRCTGWSMDCSRRSLTHSTGHTSQRSWKAKGTNTRLRIASCGTTSSFCLRSQLI